MRFWGLVAAMLATAAVLEFTSVRQESQTYDESNQLLSGYSYLKTGHYTVGLEHPPLVKLLFALPVRLLDPALPRNIDPKYPLPAGREFLYRNRVPADTMLMAGRSVAIALAALLGLAIAFWARRWFGSDAALLAVFLYAFDPNFLANGRYIKNDVPAALFIFAATMSWGWCLVKPGRAWLIAAGLLLGAALATKSSALVLLPVFAALALIRWFRTRPAPLAPYAGALVAAGVIGALFVGALYRFETAPLGQFGLYKHLPRGRLVDAAASLPVPAAAYFKGLHEVELKQADIGQSYAYLLGRHSQLGWWYMSPVAMAVKTPLSELLLFALAAGIAIAKLRRKVQFRWLVAAAVPVFYFPLTLAAHLNAGMRHLLPLYPFLFVLAAAILVRAGSRAMRIATAAACLLLVVESFSIYPHYLAFFNWAAGGPAAGPKYLVDSNLDWGQDVKNLKTYLDRHGIGEVAIRYFGTADLDYYGIRHRDLPPVPDAAAARRLDSVVAISATNLAIERERYAGLAALEPAARIGYSIYVYDLR